jgi:hypothetical protein
MTLLPIAASIVAIASRIASATAVHRCERA